MNTITRKIQLIVAQDDVQEVFHKLYSWNEIVFRSYNYVSSHLYIQENLKEFFYFNDEFKLNLSNKIDKFENPGVLNTSKQNTTYQLLSSKFKGDIPTQILSSVNTNVYQAFNAEKKEYFSGARSLRTYKRNIPIPFSASSIVKIKETEDLKNYQFVLYGISFRTNFGKDLGGNKVFFERGISKEYKLCNSSLLLQNNKIFLLAVFQFPSENKDLDKNKIAEVSLSVNNPLTVNFRNKTHLIGSKEEFQHRRLSIQRTIRELQIHSKYNKGGKGRKLKLKSLEHWQHIETKYVDNKLHNYSRQLINFCLKNKIGKIIVKNPAEELQSLEVKIKTIISDNTLSKQDKYKLIESNKFVLRNWSFSGLLDKIQYKANLYNIEIEMDKKNLGNIN